MMQAASVRSGSRATMFAPAASLGRFASTGPKKKTKQALYKMKAEGEKVSWITSYTAPQASFAEAAGIDMILVGDSGGMCALGYQNTIPVTMEEQLLMCKSARRGAPNTYIVGDMPFMSYQSSDELAVENAGRFIKEAGCDAIKLEGGVSCESRIKAIVDAGIAATVNFLGNILAGQLVPIMLGSMAHAAVWLIFLVITLLSLVFIYRRVPETKGRSLEDIEKLMADPRGAP